MGELSPQSGWIRRVWSVVVPREVVEEHKGGLPLRMTAATVSVPKSCQQTMSSGDRGATEREMGEREGKIIGSP